MKDESRTADAILSMKAMRELWTNKGFVLTLLASRVKKQPKGVALVSHSSGVISQLLIIHFQLQIISTWVC